MLGHHPPERRGTEGKGREGEESKGEGSRGEERGGEGRRGEKRGGWKRKVWDVAPATLQECVVFERTSSILITVRPVSMLTTVREDPQEQNM